MAERTDAPHPTVPRHGQRVVLELQEALTRHLAAGRPTADVGQVALAFATVFIFWDELPWWAAGGWLALFVVTAAARFAYRRRASRTLDGAAFRALVRRDVWMSASLWGGWALLLTGAPVAELTLLLVIVAGLVAAATSTLVADGPAFVGFMVVILAPTAVAVALSGLTQDHVTLLVLIALYGPFMFSVHGRTHAMLTEQVLGAARLRIGEEEMAERRDFLNALITSAPSPIVVTDREGRVVRANPAFEEVLGFPWDEAVGQLLADMVALGDNRGLLADFFRSVAGGTREVAEFQLSRRDGRPVWIRVSGTVAEGRAEGLVILVGEDVTTQVAAREAQDRARLEAEEVGRAKSAFLASMSHEIRTPLNGILGMIELLLDTDLSEDQRESAEVVRSSGKGLLRILNDVLDVSKIEAGQLDLEAIDFTVADLVEDAVRMFAGPAAARNVELRTDIGPDVPLSVHGDPVRIRQVLANLVSNAVKFTEDGEVVVSVQRPATHGDRVALVFAVEDDGIGVPLDKQAVIFEEFEQADRSTTRTHGGTGLGLTICKRLVELMGGEISVVSEPGRGSTFSFTLELGVGRVDRSVGRRAPDVTLTGRRFLVVDDDPTARLIVCEFLRQWGAGAVVEAATVEEGLSALTGADDPFDAVVVDHRMPGRGGFAFAAAVRDEPGPDPPPILLLTSADDVIPRTEVQGVGIAGYLSKPVARDELLAALRQLVGSGRHDGPERRLVTRQTLGRDRASIRILLAEDNAVNQQVAMALLTRRGYQVTPVTDGLQAVEAVDNESFDLILMDIQMPVMDGLDATRVIRSRPGLEDLPIAALTAHAFAQERERCRQAGMNDFLAKPFKPDDLFELVERWTSGMRETGRPSTNDQENDMHDDEPTPPVDIEAFRAVMREVGVEEIVDTTLDIYIGEAPELFDGLRAAVDRGDGEAIRTRAHSLKSSSGNIRAGVLAGHMQQLEQFGREGRAEEARALFPKVEREYDAVMAYLRAEREG
ncbi:MAG: response regulator [Longimicrobiales bacterium]